MGYVTAQQLITKYGSSKAACMNYLIGGMSDEDEREAVEQRLKDTSMILARLDIMEAKIDIILKR